MQVEHVRFLCSTLELSPKLQQSNYCYICYKFTKLVLSEASSIIGTWMFGYTSDFTIKLSQYDFGTQQKDQGPEYQVWINIRR